MLIFLKKCVILYLSYKKGGDMFEEKCNSESNRMENKRGPQANGAERCPPSWKNMAYERIRKKLL